MTVDLKILKNTAEELEKNRKFLQDKQEQLQHLKNEFEEFPCGNEFILRLKKIEQELEEESDGILMLSVAIEKIIDTVEKTENNIIDYYEEIIIESKNIRICNILENINENNFDNISFER